VLLNVDASFNHTRSSGSTGAVLRDSAGSFVAAAVNCFEHVLDAPMAEAMALREGMALAQMIGCSKLVIHSDCQEVVETMQQGGLSSTASAPIF
jgi:ribonuclease HI